ncbi:uncharacterized protein LOC118439499 [Folsomia candida]|nr:uncharacterized protein LOC118439499 [Folsomia candida]
MPNWVWWITTFVTGQGCDLSSGRVRQAKFCTTFRICFAVGIMFGLFINILYSSTITSALSIPMSQIPSFHALITSGFKFTAHSESLPMQNILKTALSNHGAPLDVELVESASQISHLFQPAHRTATIAYFDYFYAEATLQNYSTDFICRNIRRVTISPNSKPIYSSFIAKKSSEFTEYFNYGLMRIREAGLHHKYTTEYDTFSSHQRCDEADNTDNSSGWDSVEVTDVYFLFYILLGGMVLALIALANENIDSVKKLVITWGENLSGLKINNTYSTNFLTRK